MTKPKEVFCNRPLTKKETEAFLGRLGDADRQETIEMIYEICEKIEENDCPAVMYDYIVSIMGLCDEFI